MKKTITKSKHKTAPKDNHVQRVFNLIILDESGSMSNIAKQAISGKSSRPSERLKKNIRDSSILSRS